MNLNEKRYEVIAEYPNCPYGKTAVLEVDEDDGELYSNEFGYASTHRVVTADIADKHPHLFRRMAWYEKREFNEMPEYMFSHDKREVFKVDKSRSTDTHFNADNGEWLLWSKRTPATLADYEQFKKNEQ